jgi:hypothetical protein
VTKRNICIRLTPGRNVTKLFYGRNLRISEYAIVFVHGNTIQPSPMFADKARVYPSEPPFRYSTNRAGSWPYP